MMNDLIPENEELDSGADFIYTFGAAPGLVPGKSGKVFSARASGLYRSDDGGQTWQDALESLRLSEPVPTLCLALSPVFKQDGLLVAGSSGGVFRSTDGGASWKAILLPQPPPTVSALAISPQFAADETIFAGTMEDGVFISTDGGERWVAWNFGLLDLNVMCLAISPNFHEDETIFARTETGIFRSTNGGRAWRDVEMPFGFDAVISLAVSPGFAQDHILFAGTESQGLWVSRDAGDTWQPLGQFDSPINGIALGDKAGFSEHGILVLTSAGIWQSLDGETWANRMPEAHEGREISAVAAPNGFEAPVLVGFVDGAVETIKLL